MENPSSSPSSGKGKGVPKLLSGEAVAEHKLLMQKAREDLDTFFEDMNWKYTEVANVIAYYWADPGNGQVWKNNAWEAVQTGELNSKDFHLAFIEETKNEFATTISMMGELSKLAAMSPYSQSDRGYDLFEDRTAHFFLKPFERWGFGIVCGNPDSGKTDFTCTLMEMALGVGIPVITNIMIEDAPPGITYVRSFKAMMIACIKNLLAGKSSLIFLDEVAQFFKKKRAMSGQYINFESILFLLRKVGGNLVSIFQLPKDIPPVIEQFSDAYYQKLSRDRLLYKFRGHVNKVAGVPPTNLKFVTRDYASFELEDINVNALHRYVATLDPKKNQLEAILQYLTRLSGEITEEQEKTAISVLLRKGSSQKEIAEIWGVNQPAISKKIEKWGLNDEVAEA